MTEHTACITRLAVHQDVPHLKRLWKAVFSDDDADVDHFFETWFSPELTVVIDGADGIHAAVAFDDADTVHDDTAVYDGAKPVSAAYILPVGQLVMPDGERLDCAMLYAIATLPEYRGHGFGEKVTRVAEKLAVQKGFPAVVLKPADDKLFDFYAERSEFREFFSACITEFADTELGLPDPLFTMAPVSASEYRQLRRRLLEGGTYIDMDERGLSYQLYLCGKSGGGLYALLHEDKNAGCAVIDPDDGFVKIKELLLSGNCRTIEAVSAIAALLPAKKFEVRALPDFGENGKYRRFGMLAPIEGRPDISYVYSAKWYGLAFD